MNHHLDVPYRVLERVYSYNREGRHEAGNGSENMIHGDNLEALKSLLPQYEGRVKCIYIDYYIPVENNDELFLLEKWHDEDALIEHGKHPHLARLKEIKAEYVIDTITEKYIVE